MDRSLKKNKQICDFLLPLKPFVNYVNPFWLSTDILMLTQLYFGRPLSDIRDPRGSRANEVRNKTECWFGICLSRTNLTIQQEVFRETPKKNLLREFGVGFG